MHSKIIISSDFEATKSSLLNEVGANNLRIFDFGALASVDNAKEIINEAYIAEYEQKAIAIFALRFGNEFQNALLKILEEPPHNIVFIIICPAKNLLLPTVRSRLMIQEHKIPKKRMHTGLDLSRLDFRSAYNFIEKISALEKAEEYGKSELLALIKALIIEALQANMHFSPNELEYFNKLYSLCATNTKSVNILTPLMLLLLQKQK